MTGGVKARWVYTVNFSHYLRRNCKEEFLHTIQKSTNQKQWFCCHNHITINREKLLASKGLEPDPPCYETTTLYKQIVVTFFFFLPQLNCHNILML